MNRRVLRIVAIVVAAIIVVLGGGGVAYAYWSAGGTGSATGGTGSTVPITLSSATPTAMLYPGSSSSVSVTATNTNNASVHITTLTLDSTQGTGGFSVDAAHSGCTLSALSFATQTNGGSGWNVPGTGNLAITLPAAVTMATSAANACQGATFTVYLLAS